MRLTCDPTAALFAFTGMLLCAAVLRAEGPDLHKRLEKRAFRNAQGESIPYRLFVPKDYDATKKYPVILFLHGAGERGADNEAQLVHAEVLRLVSDEAAAREPCFLVAPQCPPGAKWVEVPWDSKKPHHTPAQPSVPMRLSLELLDSLEKEFSIDPARRCVTGLSMGGFGSFDACLHLLKAAGANAKYTEYPGVDHNSWTKAYHEPALTEWLFAQHK